MISVAVALALAACGGGISNEELEAVERDLESQRARVQELEAVERDLESQRARLYELEAAERDLESQRARMQQLEAEMAGLQQRLNQGAAIAQTVDIIIAGPDVPSVEAVRDLTSLVQASGDPALPAKWVEIIDSLLAQAGPPPPGAVAAIIAAVQASGNGQLGSKLQEFLAAVERGEGGAAFLELDAAVHASEDPALEAFLNETVGVIFRQGEPPGELIGEFIALAETSGNEEIQQAFFALGGPPPEFFEEIGAKVKAVGDPSLDALF